MENNTDISESILLDLFLNPTNISVDEFDSSQPLLDIITYSLCIIGLLLNFFAFGILRKKATMGVLLIKLILISDGLVCLLYLLNQVWTDIGLAYLSNYMESPYSPQKSIPAHISFVLRNLAIATVCVSNWYIVIMIVHRCISIYVSPLRSRIDRSLWVFIQKPANLWIAYAACWLFGSLMAFLISSNYQIILDVFMFVLPLTLVFIFSVLLLLKLRLIQRSTDNAELPSTCCLPFLASHKSNKMDSDETFAHTKHATNSAEKPSWASEETRNSQIKRSNADHTGFGQRSSLNSAANDRKKTYYRITTTILSLAVTFLILDSLQLIDLLIRIPWNKLIGGIEQAPSNKTDFDEYITEVKANSQKQHVMSIVKNTCTLGKTLANFLILCAHSRHFRAMVIVKFRRVKRFFRLIKYRIYPHNTRSFHSRFSGRNLWFIPSVRRNTIFKRQKDVNKHCQFSSNSNRSAASHEKRIKFKGINRRSSSFSGINFTHSLFRTKPRDHEGYVVQKLSKSIKNREQLYALAKTADSKYQTISANRQAKYYNPGQYQANLKNNYILTEVSANKQYTSSANNESSSNQPASTSFAKNNGETESEKSYCSTCECKMLYSSSQSISNASNLTYPGAFRGTCCVCQKAEFSDIETRSERLRFA